MAEWLYEEGIGEARAALVQDGEMIEAHIEPEEDGLLAGTICIGRLTEILVPARRGILTCERDEALLEPLPKTLTQGGQLLIEIVRQAIPEPGAVKRAKARVALPEAKPRLGPDLLARITATGIPIRHISLHEHDSLEESGWSELQEQATTGIIPFTGGTLRISLTPAMTLIDIDGHLPPPALAIAAARAVAAVIRRFDVSGSIGIDFPTLANKAERLATADAFDAILPLPYERTAINGFGFLQIIRPRARASLCERLHYERVPAAARALVRVAQRSGIIGNATITAHPSVIAHLSARKEWLDQLAVQLGGAIALQSDTGLAIGSGHVAKA